jgi:hypothetical protein
MRQLLSVDHVGMCVCVHTLEFATAVLYCVLENALSTNL